MISCAPHFPKAAIIVLSPGLVALSSQAGSRLGPAVPVAHVVEEQRKETDNTRCAYSTDDEDIVEHRECPGEAENIKANAAIPPIKPRVVVNRGHYRQNK